MAWTITDLAAVEQALRSGATTVRYGDRSVTYQSTKELRALRNEMQREIAAAAGTLPPRRSRTTRVYQSGRGW
jgi:ABC-type microcin C transport system duplicated ATPase subunit YejF